VFPFASVSSTPSAQSEQVTHFLQEEKPKAKATAKETVSRDFFIKKYFVEN
jgi:hypothetical protein